MVGDGNYEPLEAGEVGRRMAGTQRCQTHAIELLGRRGGGVSFRIKEVGSRGCGE